MSLSSEEIARYTRQVSVPAIGVEGQTKLKNASVLCVGAGGIGSPAVLYLAAMGIGKIGVIDFDEVELSNLHRQIIFKPSDTGQKKVVLAADTIKQINSTINCVAIDDRLDIENAAEIIAPFDVVLDGSDNFATRYLINDTCIELKKPFVSASVHQLSGQLTTISDTPPCYRCLFSKPPLPELSPNCSEAGVLGVIPGILGTLAVNEVVKLILGLPVLQGKLLQFDAINTSFNTVSYIQKEECDSCVKHLSAKELIDDRTTACHLIKELTYDEVLERKRLGQSIFMIDVREGYERDIRQLPDSEHAPLANFSPDSLSVEKTSPIVVYCASGGRSAIICKKLLDAGFSDVSNLAGGINAVPQGNENIQ
jgi:sulfur-carrier protein adenylyltransferase/sulfurtransferase